MSQMRFLKNHPWPSGAIIALVLCAAVFLMWPRRSGDLRAAYYSIRIGMTQEDVERMMGGPGLFSWPEYPLMKRPNECWGNTGFCFHIALDDDRRVRFKAIDYNHDPTIFDRLGNWLRL